MRVGESRKGTGQVVFRGDPDVYLDWVASRLYVFARIHRTVHYTG